MHNMQFLSTIKDKMASISKTTITTLVVALASACITYIITSNAYEDQLAQLNTQLKELKQKEQEAIVTQRISEQMGDIANEQRAISDKQRELAQQQKHIADIERGKAEMERGLALQAERKAVAAAEQADSMRVLAEHQTLLATDNLHMAEQARAEADKLYYLSLARSLSQNAITQYKSDNEDLARLLAYAAFSFTEDSNGDLYQPDLFGALVLTSHRSTYYTKLTGNVRAIKSRPYTSRNDSHTATFFASDYGSMFYCKDEARYRAECRLMNIRDIAVVDTNKCIALTSDGTLATITIATRETVSDKENSATATVIPAPQRLPQGIWKQLALTEDRKMLVARSNDMVAWISPSTLDILATTNVEGGTSVIGMQDNKLHVFADKGMHYTSTKPGVLNAEPLDDVKGKVVAYNFCMQNGYHTLGMENGEIIILNGNGQLLKTLIGHTGPITQLQMINHQLISSSYDHTLKVWNISDMSSLVTPFETTYAAWPLTFCVDANTQNIVIGHEGGEISRFCLSVLDNARYTEEKLRREFTQEEWDYYIGNTVPYRTFMNTQASPK